MADEILEIADGVKADDPIRVAQMRIDVQKRLVGKLAPKKYGVRIQHEGGDKPLVHHFKMILNNEGE